MNLVIRGARLPSGVGPVDIGIADRGYVLEQGRIVLGGTADELRSEARVARAYLGALTARPS